MRTAQSWVLVMAILVVLGSSTVTTPQDRRIVDVLPGMWDWEQAPKRCQENPHSIAFAAAGTRMEVRHPKGAVIDKEPPQVVTVYRVLSEKPYALRTQIVGETRKTDRGELVVWDLILLTPDSYCWRRTDWPPQGCTGRVLRCPIQRK
jgi:hypothetical protein